MSTADRPIAGRPPVTSHAAIEAVSFELFATQGFDETTLDDIASRLGVGRRTLFRYFQSKNDIPWGQFDSSLQGLNRTLNASPEEVPLFEAINRAVVDFNRLDDIDIPQHRQRMHLILHTPTLQAHSALRYKQWRAVIAEYVAARRGVAANSLIPRLAGHVALASALTAYEQWLESDAQTLEQLLVESASALRSILDS
ncbi:MAG: putative mycofactocin biosynthesis transcriptional regulator MftR [Nitrospira sp.]|nr:putative mycofactocin biosynthesis transcriptional regulator MftR [Nitrospira sp.]